MHLKKEENTIDLAWYEARDTVFGQNNVALNLELGLELVAACQHPGAVWLTCVVDAKNVKTKEEVMSLLFEQGRNDTRSFWLISLCSWHSPDFLASQNPEECFQLAQNAAFQGDRDGFYWLGRFFEEGTGCERNEIRACFKVGS